jgi:hypothetical protein
MSQGLIDQYLALLDEHGLIPIARKEGKRHAKS